MRDLVVRLKASESTIRRDLVELEKKNLLKRVHGGASLLQHKRAELGMAEKSAKNIQAKKVLAARASTFVKDGSCIYLDAGSTTFELIPYLVDKDITVVTNGINHLEGLVDKQIQVYVLGGKMKAITKAIVGSQAIESIQHYRFDQCFMGVNGIHPELGYTTPDPDEALLKKYALQLSNQAYILADRSKFSEISFVQFAPIEAAAIVTNSLSKELKELYEPKTSIIEAK